MRVICISGYAICAITLTHLGGVGTVGGGVEK